MPPKAKFTKDEIVCAALAICERDGIDFLTARSLAGELKSSARPVFTVFKNMDEVFCEVKKRANAVYGELVEKGLKEDIAFKGVGKAYIKFASLHPKLFCMLFMNERESYNQDNVLPAIEEHYENILDSIENSYSFDRQTAKTLYMHMWIYTHGIASLIATGVCRFSEEKTSEMLTEVFTGLIIKIKTGSLK